MDLESKKVLWTIGKMLLEDGFIFKLFFMLMIIFCCAIVSYGYKD
jgi:hypothetical protein